MNLKELGQTAVLLPEIGLGTWQYRGGMEPIRKAIALGSSLVDTAESYCTEEIVGARNKDGELLPDKQRITQFGQTVVERCTIRLPHLSSALDGLRIKSVSAPKPNLEGDVLLLDPKTKFLSLVPTPGEIAPQYQTTVISSDDVAATAALKGSHEQGAPACSS
jgi:hypothetical protein